jgi:hypothetical protein
MTFFSEEIDDISDFHTKYMPLERSGEVHIKKLAKNALPSLTQKKRIIPGRTH